MQTIAPVRRRFGCLGCLGQIAFAVILGVVLVMGSAAVFTPWGYFLGGSRHLLPGWQGVGRIHAAAGDYTLYVSITPSRGTPRYNLPQFSGTGYLCTPRGERFQLHVRGGMLERPGSDTNGKEMTLTFYQRPWYYSFSWPERRPEFHFRGRWQNPDLVVSDEGSFSRAFLPDGSVYLGPGRNQPKAGAPVTVVFHEVGWAGWWADCRGTAAGR